MTLEPVVGVVFGHPVVGKTILSYICLPSTYTGLSAHWNFVLLPVPMSPTLVNGTWELVSRIFLDVSSLSFSFLQMLMLYQLDETSKENS